MESLALAAAFVMIAVCGVGLGALVAGVMRLRILGNALGLLAVLAGAWLAGTLPHLWWLGAAETAIGVWAIWRAKR